MALLLVMSTTLATSVKFQCTYGDMQWTQIGLVYRCYTKNVRNEDSEAVFEENSGSHINNKTDNEVTAFTIHEATCNYLPAGIKKIFKNLEGLEIANAGLKVITQQDLRPLTKLRSFFARGNQITHLEPNLFYFNRELVIINLTDNKIVFIGQGVFDPITDLQQLHLNYNVCISKIGASRQQVKDVQKHIAQSCEGGLIEKVEKMSREIEELKILMKKLETEVNRLNHNDEITNF